MEVKVKRWGNSLGVILPKEFVEDKKIKENDVIDIAVVKPIDLRKIFGSGKGKTRMTGQEFKDMVRKGWD